MSTAAGVKMGGKWFAGATVDDILAVSAIEPIGSLSWQKLYQTFDTLAAVLKGSRDQLIGAGLTNHQASCLASRSTDLSAAKRLLASKQIEIITLDSPDYPTLLKEITDPPLWLFLRGDVEVFKRTSLTVVGTRKPSASALLALDKLLPEDLVKQVCLVSGLAYGTDKKVHQLALQYQSPTIAVLAGGLDSIYPADHYRLADEIIAAGGLLVSEYPPLCRPRPEKFPVRNRIIAGLSPVTVVAEAAIRSGSLTTAASAINYNREVLAVPADITRPNVDGTNFLIKQGAMLLDSPEQIYELYGFKPVKPVQALDEPEGELLHLLAKQALSVDQIGDLTKESIPSILGILTELELQGRVFQSQPGFYQAKK